MRAAGPSRLRRPGLQVPTAPSRRLRVASESESDSQVTGLAAGHAGSVPGSESAAAAATRATVTCLASLAVPGQGPWHAASASPGRPCTVTAAHGHGHGTVGPGGTRSWAAGRLGSPSTCKQMTRIAKHVPQCCPSGSPRQARRRRRSLLLRRQHAGRRRHRPGPPEASPTASPRAGGSG